MSTMQESKSSAPMNSVISDKRDAFQADVGGLELHYTVATKQGGRKSQEDRIIACTNVGSSGNRAFFGVFDGTAGDTASSFVQTQLLSDVAHYSDEQASKHQDTAEAPKEEEFAEVMTDAYTSTEAALLKTASGLGQEYSASTSATVFLCDDTVTVSHLGDSRVIAGFIDGEKLVSEVMTKDHKPDLPEEKERIDAAGGKLVFIRSGKPFLRGGEGGSRNSAVRAKQLNYSRAFGCAPLKEFGLSAKPTTTQFSVKERNCRVIIIGSDGLWDVIGADEAVTKALASHDKGQNPAQMLSDYALWRHEVQGSSDNVSVIVVVISPKVETAAKD